MVRIATIVLALGLVALLHGTALANVPKTDQPETARWERARLRWAITQFRALLAQLKDPRACVIPQEVQAAERLLEEMEWAYAHGKPSPVKLPKPAR